MPRQRGRLADRAARVRADRQRHVVGGHGRGRPAAAATRHAIELPRVGGRAVRGVLGRRAHRELVHVRLAEDDRADVAEALGDVGVVRGEIALEDARAGGALAALHGHEVLEARPGCRAAGGAPRAPRGPRRAPRPGGHRRRPPRPGRARGRWSARRGGRGPAPRRGRDAPRSARARSSSPARSRAAMWWAWRRVRSVVIGWVVVGRAARRQSRSPRIAGTTKNVSVARRRVGEHGLGVQRRPGDVVAQDVLELDRLGRRRDVVGRDAWRGSRTGRGCG